MLRKASAKQEEGPEKLPEENLHIRNYLENEKHLEPQKKPEMRILSEGRGVSRGALGEELRWKEDWKVAGCRVGQKAGGCGGGAAEREQEWLQRRKVG